MKCRMLDRQENEALFELVFPLSELTNSLLRAFHAQSSLSERHSAALFSLSEAVLRSGKGVSISRAAVHDLYSRNLIDTEERLSFTIVSEPFLRSSYDDIEKEIHILCKAEALPSLSDLGIYQLRVPYKELYLDGTELDRKLSYMKQYYGTDSHAVLAKHIPGCKNAGSVKKVLGSYLKSYVEKANALNRRKAVVDGIMAVCPLVSREEEVNVLVNQEIDKMRSQLGVDRYESQLSEGSHTEEEIRQMISKDVQHVPAMNKVLSAVARQMGVAVSDAKRLAAIEVQRTQRLLFGEVESAEETLSRIKQDSTALALLDESVARDEAFERLVKMSDIWVQGRISLLEGAPQVVNSAVFEMC